MVERKVTVVNPTGLHLRPAGLLCQTSMKFDSKVMIFYKEKEINAKSVLNVMASGIRCGDEITVHCDGPDEKEEKNNLLPPPVKKKYSKEHIYVLTFIYYLKNILSISDIQKLLNPLTDKFFNTDGVPALDTIYKEIYDMEKLQLEALPQDVLGKTELSKQAFCDVENEEDKDFLQLFMLVCLLSFDVYMKKNIIESLIDDYTAKKASSDKPKTKEEIKEEKREAKEEAKEAKRAAKQKK